MKQKRFRKMLMSKGYGRNEVDVIVKNAIQLKKPYAEIYKALELQEKAINIVFDAGAFQEAIKQLNKVAQACGKALRAFADTFTEAMREGRDND